MRRFFLYDFLRIKSKISKGCVKSFKIMSKIRNVIGKKRKSDIIKTTVNQRKEITRLILEKRRSGFV